MFSEPRTYPFVLDGGIDFISSHLEMNPGGLIAGSNIKMIGGRKGYERVAGYERCTNDILPSLTTIEFFLINAPFGVIGENVEFTSGDMSVRPLETNDEPTSGDVIVIATHSTGFAAGQTFTDGINSFQIASVLEDTSAFTSEQVQEYRKSAIEQTRGNIPKVPDWVEPEDIDGGFRLRGKNYIFYGGKMFRGDSYSWTEIAMPDVMYFKEGDVEPGVGDEITDGTATATIASITKQSGAWDDTLDPVDKAAGYFTLTSVSGTFPVDAVLTVDAVTTAKVESTNTTYAITAGGKYEVVTHNFTNLADSPNAYGVSGVCEAFEFDGVNYIPIYHPDASTFPDHLNIHQERLHLVFPGGQKPYSVSGQPRVFDTDLGAGTWSTGSEIVGARTIHGNAEVVYCEDCTWLLLGDGIYNDTTATRNWQFYKHDEDIGAEEWSVAAHGRHVFMSNAELRAFGATDTAALYTSYPIAEEINPWFEDGVRSVVAALWCKSESQYRIFFDDGRGFIITFHQNKVKGATPIRLPDGISSAWRAYEDGTEYLFFVSNTGYLYRMDSGHTHDERFIEGSLRVPFFHYGSPSIDKMFPQITIELDAPVLLSGDTEITYTVNYNYGSSDSPRPLPTVLTELEGAGGMYGSNDGYGNFVWSGPIVSEIHGYIDGYGANMSILITFKTKYDSSFRMQTVMTEYIPLGRRRK